MLDYVNSILKNYNLGYNLPSEFSEFAEAPILTKYLKPMIEERGVTDKIHLYETDHSSDTILAMVQMDKGVTAMYGGSQNIAHIYFQKRLNYCWRRFVLFKEMYHCMLDRTMDERVTSIDNLNRLVELLGHDTTSVSGGFAPLITEKQAELLALETLMPVEYRLKIQKKYSSGEIKAEQIAKAFKIPEAYVRFSMQPSYLEKIVAYRAPLLF